MIENGTSAGILSPIRDIFIVFSISSKEKSKLDIKKYEQTKTGLNL